MCENHRRVETGPSRRLDTAALQIAVHGKGGEVFDVGTSPPAVPGPLDKAKQLIGNVAKAITSGDAPKAQLSKKRQRKLAAQERRQEARFAASETITAAPERRASSPEQVRAATQAEVIQVLETLCGSESQVGKGLRGAKKQRAKEAFERRAIEVVADTLGMDATSATKAEVYAELHARELLAKAPRVLQKL
ncbi:hypothetical protein COV82_06550 [Candidatus Peregrinibacteria bacterium CG11_big_fil_rev_8_21_14_0_20_46_8]|nr:MAG: hypothetical protein COV82_06550 [Candidatus Peregrinibacteria bacterium CG11_big_fil_rev_8_21_14_0_20_46_8]